MDYLEQAFSVRFEYKVFFTTDLFSKANTTFTDFIQSKQHHTTPKILFVADEGVVQHHPKLLQDIRSYFSDNKNITLMPDFVIIPGGESTKNDEGLFHKIVEAVNHYGIDRHSYIAAIGGGSVLDLVGYAAAVSHRGVRHIRIPTTVLSQNDSGVGVKNGINWFSKKNFLGTFAPPVAVFNDYNFLTTLNEADWRSGMSEAIKVALIKDAVFFEWLVNNAAALVKRDMAAMQYLIKRCAELHLQHISSKDPFETGSARPLDFGHWSAHKLEQLTHFSVRHGEAVAMGIALDSVYSYLSGRLTKSDADRIISLISTLGFSLTHPLLHVTGNDSPLLKGLNEFREHLGGKLTITLLKAIGEGEEVHEMDHEIIQKSSAYLEKI
ncbi:MAG TPA: 3-dehydroquinate synthase [Ohtaekwangia sp.]